jgi:hypothetical protein
MTNKPEYYRPRGRIYLYPAGGRRGEGCPFTQGTFWDLEEEGIAPKPGMKLQFYADDGNEKGERDYLLFSGIIDCDQSTGEWYALIDKGSFCHESDLAAGACPSSASSPG